MSCAMIDTKTKKNTNTLTTAYLSPKKQCASGSTALRTELRLDERQISPSFHQPLKCQATNPVLKHRCLNSSQWTINNMTDRSDPCDVCTLDFVHEILLTFYQQHQ